MLITAKLKVPVALSHSGGASPSSLGMPTHRAMGTQGRDALIIPRGQDQHNTERHEDASM